MHYLIPLVLLALASLWTNARRHYLATDYLLIGAFLFIGALRMSHHVYSFVSSSQSSLEVVSQVHEYARRCADMLEARLSASGIQASEFSITNALLLGRRAYLDTSVREQYAQTGSRHLLALSGMHLGVIFGLFSLFCLRWVRYSFLRWWVIPLLIGGIWFYVLMAHSPASLVRAASMLSFYCISILFFRRLTLLHCLSLTLLLMLFARPMWLFDVGFQLSFVAVLFISLVYIPLSSGIQSWHPLFRIPFSLFLLSLVAHIATLPLCAYYFHVVPWAGSLASVLLIPLTSIHISLGVAILIYPTPILATCIQGCHHVQQVVMDTILRLFPTSPWTNIHPSVLSLVLIYTVLLACGIRLYNAQRLSI